MKVMLPFLPGWQRAGTPSALIGCVLWVGCAAAAVAGDLKHPDWHPSGEWLVAEGECDQGIDVVLVNLGSGELTTLVSSPDTDGYPRWSLDGRSVYFHRMSEGSARIYRVDLDEDMNATGQQRITDGTFDIEPAPSPNGQRLAYSSRGDAGQRVTVMDLANPAQVRVLEAKHQEHFPSWVDGDTLLFTSTRDGYRRLYRWNTATGEVVPALPIDGTSMFGQAEPGGEGIAYSTELDGDREVMLWAPDMETPVNLSRKPGRDGYPKFSPGGDAIAWHSTTDDVVSIVVQDLRDGSRAVFACP